MTSTQPLINLQREGNVSIVEFVQADILDQAYIERLGTELRSVVQSLDSPNVIVDLHNVRHLSSAGIGMLIAAQQDVSLRDGQMRLINVEKPIHDILKLMRVHKRLPVHKSKEEALKKFK